MIIGAETGIDGERAFTTAYSDRTKGNCFKIRQVNLIRYKEEILHEEGGEALVQADERSCGCPICGDIQGQVGF